MNNEILYGPCHTGCPTGKVVNALYLFVSAIAARTILAEMGKKEVLEVVLTRRVQVVVGFAAVVAIVPVVGVVVVTSEGVG